MGCTFGQVEALIARVNSVADVKRATLTARLKQLQRLKFPPGVNTGRNARMDYTSDHIFQLAYVMVLLDIGLPPDRAIKALLSDWPLARTATLDAISRIATDSDEPVYLIAHCETLLELRPAKEKRPLSVAYPAAKSWQGHEMPTGAAMALVPLVRRVLFHLNRVHNNPRFMRRELADWAADTHPKWRHGFEKRVGELPFDRSKTDFKSNLEGVADDKREAVFLRIVALKICRAVVSQWRGGDADEHADEDSDG